MEYISDKLELEYEMPHMSLGHCVGHKQYKFLQSRFGSTIVDEIQVGSEFQFELSAPDTVELKTVGQMQ